jgi:hypothetical protein
MRVTFWGTRGSCPAIPAAWEVRAYAEGVSAATIAYFRERLQTETGLNELRELLQGTPEEIESELPIAHLPIFGGETTCVEIETSEGNVIILDCGSGIRNCAAEILQRRSETKLSEISVFGSHAHLDHRNGLSFAGICFANPPFDIQVFGCSGFLKALDSRFAMFSHTVSESTYSDDPIDYTAMSASFSGVEIRALDGEEELEPGAGAPWQVRDIAAPIMIGSTAVRPFKSYHGSTECLGYRIEHGGKSFVFSTDHEKLSPEPIGLPNLGSDEVTESLQAEQKLIEMCQGADLAYFDGQYFREEYYGHQGIGSSPAMSRVGWGHGCVEDILERVSQTGINHALIGHHDPQRNWPAQMAMAEQLQKFSTGKDFQIELARDGQTVTL